MPVFYRVWALGLQDGRTARCRECRAPVRWVYTDKGKKLPLEPGSVPVRREVDARSGARFEVYAGEASHLWHCPAKKSG